VVRAAIGQLGTPYVWGGTTTRGFDCSGLVRWAYRAGAHVLLGRTTYAQANQGIHVRLPNVRRGDVLFVNGMEHEGLYIGNGVVVHAPHTGDVVRRTSLRSFLGEGLTAVRRYIKRTGRVVR
jgi:cell wall-associated NlpC family hydrolase